MGGGEGPLGLISRGPFGAGVVVKMMKQHATLGETVSDGDLWNDPGCAAGIGLFINLHKVPPSGQYINIYIRFAHTNKHKHTNAVAIPTELKCVCFVKAPQHNEGYRG